MIEYEGLTPEQNQAVTRFNELAKILGLKQKYDTVDFNNALFECVDKLFIPEGQAEMCQRIKDDLTASENPPQTITYNYRGIQQPEEDSEPEESCDNCGNNKINKSGYCHCDYSGSCNGEKWTPKQEATEYDEPVNEQIEIPQITLASCLGLGNIQIEDNSNESPPPS